MITPRTDQVMKHLITTSRAARDVTTDPRSARYFELSKRPSRTVRRTLADLPRSDGSARRPFRSNARPIGWIERFNPKSNPAHC